MYKDRKKICDVISNMLDNPDKYGIFSTGTAYTQLEYYIESVRSEAIGWTHAFCCLKLDRDEDPRLCEVPFMYKQSKIDLKN